MMGTHVSRVGLDHSPVHVVGGQVSSCAEYGVSIRRFLVLFILHRRIIRSEMSTRAIKGEVTYAEQTAPSGKEVVSSRSQSCVP